MTTSQLEALLIDQALGELPEDIDALLTAYLEVTPARHEEVRLMRESLQLTGDVVAKCPELFSFTAAAPPAVGWVPMPGRFWLKTAAVFLALAFAAGAGYRTGRESENQGADVIVEKAAASGASDSPWARYVVAADGRLAVVPAMKPGS